MTLLSSTKYEKNYTGKHRTVSISLQLLEHSNFNELHNSIQLQHHLSIFKVKLKKITNTEEKRIIFIIKYRWKFIKSILHIQKDKYYTTVKRLFFARIDQSQIANCDFHSSSSDTVIWNQKIKFINRLSIIRNLRNFSHDSMKSEEVKQPLNYAIFDCKKKKKNDYNNNNKRSQFEESNNNSECDPRFGIIFLLKQ